MRRTRLGHLGGPPGPKKRYGGTLDLSLVKEGNVAWSPQATANIRDGHMDMELGLEGSPTKAFVGRSRKIHTLQCHYVLCTKGALKGRAFHGAVRVMAEHQAIQAGFVRAMCCHYKGSKG